MYFNNIDKICVVHIDIYGQLEENKNRGDIKKPDGLHLEFLKFIKLKVESYLFFIIN